MRDEAEVEIIDSAEHCEGAQNHNSPSETGALVEVTFQKNPSQKLKYLEAEPKALGITQILLSLFVISTSITTLQEQDSRRDHFIFSSLSTVGIIAGSVAIAAQSLHLPKLKACLGVQVVMCVVSAISFIMNSKLLMDSDMHLNCWTLQHENNSTMQPYICNRLLSTYYHVLALGMLVLATQIAISATLSAFCCKVIQCCSPQSSIPMIVVNTPSAPQ